MRCYICHTTFLGATAAGPEEPCDCGQCLSRSEYLDARGYQPLRAMQIDRWRHEWARTGRLTEPADGESSPTS